MTNTASGHRPNLNEVLGSERSVVRVGADFRVRRLRRALTMLAAAMVGAVLVAQQAAVAREARQAEATPIAAMMHACDVAPRPAEDFRALSEASPGRASEPGDGTPGPATAGEPAPPEIDESVTQSLHDLAACTNAGDIPRIAALYTDAAFARLFSGPGADVSDDALALLLEPQPLPESRRIQVRSIDDIRVQSNGRVTAVMQTTAGATRFELVAGDARYLIDAVEPLDDIGTPVAP